MGIRQRTEQEKELESRYLLSIYRSCGDDPHCWVNWRKLGEELGWDEDDTLAVKNRLVRSGLIFQRSGEVSLNSNGLDRARELDAGAGETSASG